MHDTARVVRDVHRVDIVAHQAPPSAHVLRIGAVRTADLTGDHGATREERTFETAARPK